MRAAGPTGQYDTFLRQRVNCGRVQPENRVPYGRVAATRAIQFNFLVTMTKPIIPLFMIITTGQVNGRVGGGAECVVKREGVAVMWR